MIKVFGVVDFLYITGKSSVVVLSCSLFSDLLWLYFVSFQVDRLDWSVVFVLLKLVVVNVIVNQLQTENLFPVLICVLKIPS